MSIARRLKYLVTLRTIATLLGKPFSEATRAQVVLEIGEDVHPVSRV
ncbi:MAG: hypothetical protein WC941_07930 [Candidatus Bathyarchaeia archaeon]